jgi:hypothetical protein
MPSLALVGKEFPGWAALFLSLNFFTRAPFQRRTGAGKGRSFRGSRQNY